MDAGRYREVLTAAAAELAAVPASGPRDKKLDALLLLGIAETRLALFKEAGVHFAQALALLDPLKDEDQLAAARVWNEHAELQYALANWDEALALTKKALTIRQKKLPADDPDLAESLNNTGYIMSVSPARAEDRSAAATARRYMLQAWSIRNRKLGAEAPETAESWTLLGLFFLTHDAGENPFGVEEEQGTLVDRCLQKGLDIRRKVLRKQHPDLAESLMAFALVDLLRARLDDADRRAAEGLSVLEANFGPNHPDVAFAVSVIGQIRQAQERPVEAEALYRRALTIYEKVFGPQHSFVGTALEKLVTLYTETGQNDKIAPLQRRLDRIRGRDI